jgi:hypothetical protein
MAGRLPKAGITSSTLCGRAGLLLFVTVYRSMYLTDAGVGCHRKNVDDDQSDVVLLGRGRGLPLP